ncbi:MAG: bifunctional [glutamine synthetase] adenylyltransferase/[glutamine synthetase]-adenylyl-L-tyrosine phosphorylase [Proteobacteria bacterium]|nr:bifunctional [glutamine synthetase] adenylyltransferase/[glutamine synthetase]-adenylyl-L-tyrosine phosphorylase [Pseudomonadota bacterium]
MELFFRDSPDTLPRVGDAARAAAGLENWAERSAKIEDPDLARFTGRLPDDPAGRRLLEAIFANSPFLTHCALSDMGCLARILTRGPDAVLSEVMGRLKDELSLETERDRLMAGLRRARRQAALLVALADITGTWSVERVTEALSDFADAALSAALCHLLRCAAESGELALARPETPEWDCGYVVLAMGKLGARELNYSSDIDLILLYDPDRARYLDDRGPQEGFVRMTRDLVRLLEERTAEGHVFRTDLRLRPDPGAMPLAISFTAALTYYESMGQNWERAAMIKARPAAGDLELGARFLDELRPFIWRKHLDFWAIQDIHSIKRQIYAHKGGAKIAVRGHDIKLGRGGIREIELFAQTQQLIWGGREPRLRCARTIEALAALAAAGHIDAGAADALSACYRFLRRLEHRLQMVDDRQTQRLPDDEPGIARIAAFMGYDDAAAFRAALLATLGTVEDHYAELFEEAPALSPGGNLVFTGGEPEPGTLATLQALGFREGTKVFNLVRAWHHGRHRATRSTRARELLTELMPTLLEALGKTTQPDLALAKFDEFLAGLPAGVQLFSMLYANPRLLDMLAEIMGGAPALAERLSRNPALLDAVLSLGFFDPIPGRAALGEELDAALAQARDFQDVLDLARRWANDRRFQAGVHILRHKSDMDEAGRALSDIADTVLAGLYPPVLDELARVHGRIAGPGLVVLAMGKLGAREMTFASDLDLIFIYDAAEDAERSDGAKPLPTSQYFARFAQRYINALSALTPEGRLYDIDMRLRPSGNKGPIATTLAGWRRYYQADSWTWEHMALSRARVVAGDPDLGARIEAAIGAVLTAPHDPDKLLIDVAEMRARIEREHPAKTIWSVKFLRGGLTDLEFLAQYLLLRHAHDHPQIIDASTQAVFAKLAEAGLLGPSLARRLIAATRLIRQVQGMLRLTAAPAFDADSGTEGLKASLARAAGMADFASLRETLIATAAEVHEVFIDRIEAPARALGAELGSLEEKRGAGASGRLS